MLPDGGDTSVIDRFAQPLAEVLASAKQIEMMQRSETARKLWHEEYGRLADADDIATERARPQVLRLSMLYTLLDGSAVVDEKHLKAALAVWDYCEASAKYLFSERCNNIGTQGGQAIKSLAVRLLNFIIAQPGINRRGLYDRLGGQARKEDMDKALAYLETEGLAHPQTINTGGRPGECWFAGRAKEQTSKVPDDDEPDLCSIARSEGEKEEESQEEATAIQPRKCQVKIEEIPVPRPGLPGSLESVPLDKLFALVREIGGRLVWIDEGVRVVAFDGITPVILAAFKEHQEQLKPFVQGKQPSQEDLFLYELQIVGTDEWPEYERRKSGKPKLELFPEDGSDLTDAA